MSVTLNSGWLDCPINPRKTYAEIFLYLYQYRIERPWRGLLILQSPRQDLGSVTPYSDLLDGKVQRIYLQDLIGQTSLPPALALLQLIVLPDSAAPEAASTILDTATGEGSQVFRQTLDLVEAILISKFPQLTSQEILAMLDIKITDLRQTRFYQEVLEEGREEGREEGAQLVEANILIRLLVRNLGSLSETQEAHIRALPIEQLDELLENLFDFANQADLDAWLQSHPVESRRPES